MADVTARMLNLLSLLQSGRSFNAGELADRLGVSLRTLRRDIDRLRGYGYPVHAKTGPGGYYRLASGRTVPPLLLDDDEAVATLVGLASLAATSNGAADGVEDAAARAFGKIDQVLPQRLQPRARAMRASLESSNPGAPKLSPGVVAALADATARQELVRFRYVDAAGSTSQRRVEPYRQVHVHLRWYLVGWDRDRRDWRTFRIDRITGVAATNTHFRLRPLPSESAVEFVRAGLRTGRQPATIDVELPIQSVADALRYELVDLVALSPSRTRAIVWYESWEWLMLYLAVLDAPFEFGGPYEGHHACMAFATRLLTALDK